MERKYEKNTDNRYQYLGFFGNTLGNKGGSCGLDLMWLRIGMHVGLL
jgi:hypothetical protein